MSGTAQIESFTTLGGDTGEGKEAQPLQLAPLNPSPETIPGVGTAGDVDSYEIFGDSLHLTEKILEPYLQNWHSISSFTKTC